MLKHLDLVLSQPELDILNCLLPTRLFIHDYIQLPMDVPRVATDVPVQFKYSVKY